MSLAKLTVMFKLEALSRIDNDEGFLNVVSDDIVGNKLGEGTGESGGSTFGIGDSKSVCRKRGHYCPWVS